MNYVYQALPFRGHVERVDANAVAKQLNELINNQAAAGWEFYQINSVSINVTPGCLASLFGAKGFPMSYDMAIFRRELHVKTSIKDEKIFTSQVPTNLQVEDPNSPAILEMKKKSEPYLNKLINLGYSVTKSKITEKSAYWEFKFTSNTVTFEINSFKELQDFANNF
jgi:hypothetical protein